MNISSYSTILHMHSKTTTALFTRQATSTESLLFLSAGERHNSMRRGTAEGKYKGFNADHLCSPSSFKNTPVTLYNKVH